MDTRVLFKYGIAVAAVLILFSIIPVRSVISQFADLSPVWCALALVLQLIVRALGALNLAMLTRSQGDRVSFATAFVILLTTQFYSLVLPGAVATGGVTWLKYRAAGASSTGAAVTIVANRSFNLTICLMLGVLTAAWDPLLPILQHTPMLGFALCLLGVVGLILFLLPKPRTATLAPQPTLAERLLRLVGFSRELRTAIIISHLLHVACASSAIWCFARALDLPIDWNSSFWIYALLQTAILVPITVAGIGTRDATLLGVGILLSLSAAQALAWSMVLLGSTVLFALIGGLLELAPRTWVNARSDA